MMRLYVTFGQDHIHRIDGRFFDKDCVAVIGCDSEKHGRSIAFELFNGKFATSYIEGQLDKVDMAFFPRGKIKAN